jgi:uncharacterized 2Fe-2S/4Fe-4S cluster protein (DUF4445 family)
MKSVIVTCQPEGTKIDARPGESVLDLLSYAGLDINNQCGGEGVCGKCRVKITRGKVNFSTKHLGFLTKRDLEAGFVLACQTEILNEDLEVWIPPESRKEDIQILTQYDVSFDWLKYPTESRLEQDEALTVDEILRYESPGPLDEGPDISRIRALRPLCQKYYLELPAPSLSDTLSDLDRIYRELRRAVTPFQVLRLRTHFSCLWGLAAKLRHHQWKITATVHLRDLDAPTIRSIEGGDASRQNFGVAIDVGTTTIVAQLVDLYKGEVVGVEASQNSQVRYGEDVISRMIFACGQGGLASLTEAVGASINSLIDGLVREAHIEHQDITCLVAAGNTTMTHLLLGLDPRHIRFEPYIPTANRFPRFQAAELGLHAHPKAILHCLPCVSSYVGGDITAGVLACGMSDHRQVSALIDVGTNGEIVIGNKEWLVCCSCSAGPAFEGGGVKCGMRAMRGAIEKVRITRRKTIYWTVGNARPLGICGSGLVDAIAELAAERIIDQNGKFIRYEHPRVRVVEGVTEFVLAQPAETQTGEAVSITEDDIGNLIKSKGAVLAAMRVLLENLEISFNDLGNIYVAGGFGAHLDIDKAVFIGLLPDIPRDRIRFIGNSSLAGARLALLSTEAFRKAESIARQMTYFELSVHPEFMQEFVASMFIPHTQMEFFPSVQTTLLKRSKLFHHEPWRIR